MHDFLIPDLGRVSPYGIYDLGQNAAWVSVGGGETLVMDAPPRGPT